MMTPCDVATHTSNLRAVGGVAGRATQAIPEYQAANKVLDNQMIVIAKQGSQEWLDARRGKVTASVSAACLGLDPHMSRQKAWRLIMGTEVVESNNHLERGKDNESAARSAYELETGNIVMETGFWVHPTMPWIGASPDGLIGADGLAEIKCPWVVHDEIPEHYRTQMIVQLAVTERKWCDFFSWTYNQSRVVGRVERDLPVEQEVLAGLLRFYLDYVQTNTEPPRKKRKAS